MEEAEVKGMLAGWTGKADEQAIHHFLLVILAIFHFLNHFPESIREKLDETILFLTCGFSHCFDVMGRRVCGIVGLQQNPSHKDFISDDPEVSGGFKVSEWLGDEQTKAVDHMITWWMEQAVNSGLVIEFTLHAALHLINMSSDTEQFPQKETFKYWLTFILHECSKRKCKAISQ
jgi:hypothetical protein